LEGLAPEKMECCSAVKFQILNVAFIMIQSFNWTEKRLWKCSLL